MSGQEPAPTPARVRPPGSVRGALDAAETGPLSPLQRLVLVAVTHLRGDEGNATFTPAGVAALLGLDATDVHAAGHELWLRGLIQ